MAGLADLFGMGGDSGGMFGGTGGLYGDLLTPEMKQQMAFRGLMAAAGAFGQAAMPSRMPIPIGAALGSAASAMAGAQDQGLESALKVALTGGKLQELKSKIALQQALTSGAEPPMFSTATPSGAPQPLAPAPVAPGADTLGSSSVGGRGGWGPLAQPAVETLSGSGMSPAAVQGIMANGLGEGGFNDPWKKAGGGENSFGHWQFNQGGELPGYLAWAQGKGDPKDTKLQAQYVAQRMEELHPGFSQLDDPKLATDIVATKFERYQGAKPGQRYGYLADVQKAMSGGTVEPRQPIPAAPGQLTDEGVLVPVPNFSGAMAGNQGPDYAPPVAPAATFPAPDTVIASPGGNINVGRLIMDPSVSNNAEGRAAAAPMGQLSAAYANAVSQGFRGTIQDFAQQQAVPPPAPSAPVQVAQNGPLTSLPSAPSVAAPAAAPLPAAAALSATPPPAQSPYGGVNPAYIQWAQTQARLRTALGIAVPAHISEAAKLPLDYAAPGANAPLQGQIAGEQARQRQPYELQRLQEQARLDIEKAGPIAQAQATGQLGPEMQKEWWKSYLQNFGPSKLGPGETETRVPMPPAPLPGAVPSGALALPQALVPPQAALATPAVPPAAAAAPPAVPPQQAAPAGPSVAPSAAIAPPITMSPGGAVTMRGADPGAVAEAKGRGEANVKRETDYRAAGDAAQSMKATILNISSELQNVVHGPFADWAQLAASYGRLVDPSFNQQVKSYEEANSAVNELVRKAVKQSDPNPTFLQTKMAIDAMPTPLRSPGGVEKITNRMIGLQNHDIARAAMLDQYQAANGGSVQGFDSWWRERASPFAFIMARMPAEDKLQLVNFLNKTKQGQGEKERLIKQMEFISQTGLEH